MPTAARVRRDLLALVAYFLLTLALTYPLVLNFGTHVPGDGRDDPALAWNLWWVRYALLNLGRSPIYTDYLFFPIGLNLAFYTLTYLNAFLSVPLQFVLGIVPAANVNLIMSFTLSGFGAYLLVMHLLRSDSLGVAHFAAFAAGLLYAFSSNKFLYASLGQFNIASSQWIPFYILFLLKLFPTCGEGPISSDALRFGFLLGLFLLFQALSEFIFASFLALFTIAYLVYWLVVRRFSLRGEKWPVISLGVAAVTFLLPMSPILAAMVSDMLAEGDFIQSGLGFSNTFSADLLGFFIPSHLHPLFGGLEAQLHFAYTNFVYLGYVALALAVIALLRVPRARIWGLWFALVLLLSLGPTLRVDGREFQAPFLPFNALLEIPLVKGNRYPSRWSVLLTLTLAVMVGYGLAWLLGRISQGRKVGPSRFGIVVAKRRSRVLSGRIWGLGFSTLLLFEHFSLPLPLSDLRVPSVYASLARDPGSFAVMELPLAWRNGFRVTGSYRAGSQAPLDRGFMLAQWYQTGQQHPILNGNTSRNPEGRFQYFSETPVLDSIIAIQTGHEVSAQTRARDRELGPRLLASLNVHYVIWHTPYETANQEAALKTRAYVEDIFPLTKVEESYENGRGLVVYRADAAALGDDSPLKLESDPLERLYFGEGWGALQSGAPLLAERKEARVFLPASEQGKMQVALENIAVPPGQGMSVEVNGQMVAPLTSLPTALPEYRFAIPASARHVGVNELVFRFSTVGPVGQLPKAPVPIGRTGATSPNWIVVRSAGEDQGDFGHIDVNGVDESPNGRGYNLVVIDPPSGRVEARAHFDTCACDPGGIDPERASHALAAFIEQLADGKIVAVAVRDEASLHLTGDAVQALQLLGAQVDLRGRFRWSHGFVGVKGAPAGSAQEAASEFDVSQVVVGEAATEPNYAALIGGISIQPSR